MVMAAIGDTSYNITLLLHVLTAMAALAPALVHPLLRRQLSSADRPGQLQRLSTAMDFNSRRLYAPALIITGLLGFALSGMSDGAHSFGDDWMRSAIIVWVLMNGVLHAVILPASKAVGSGQPTEKAFKRLNRGSALMTILFVVQLWLMIFKPGA